MCKEIIRNFIPGDKWLYYKIYTGYKTTDLVLKNYLSKVIYELLEQNIINKWFYIRYSDPENHLRIRFYCDKSDKISVVISKLNIILNNLLSDKLIWNVQIDIYKRELERYSENNIVNSEDLFYNDSDMMLRLIRLFSNDSDENLRWILGIRLIDTFLNSFKYKLEEKLILLENLKNAFANEFNINKNLKLQLDKKYRMFSKKISNSIENCDSSIYNNIINTRDNRNQVIIDKIINLCSSNMLMVKLDNLMSSYIHMSMNRLFCSDNRLHEFVIYYFMFKYYKSLSSRYKYNSKK